MSSNDMEGILAAYISAHSVITRPISSLSVLFFVYGIYTVVFGLSTYILLRHNPFASKLYMGWTISLFVLATLYTAVEAWGLTRQAIIQFHAATTRDYSPLLDYISGDKNSTACLAITTLAATLMNVIADSILIHRCYVVWSSDKIILYLFAFVALILNGMNFGCVITATTGFRHIAKQRGLTLFTSAQSIDSKVVTGIMAFQLLLAIMTGGRIWWISREARKLMGTPTNTRYKTIIALVIESGLLYASTLLATFITSVTSKPGTSSIVGFDPTELAVLMSGLAPTLIIARVGYGKSIDNVQQVVSTFQFGNGHGSQFRRSAAPSRATIDLPLQVETEGPVVYSGAFQKRKVEV